MAKSLIKFGDLKFVLDRKWVAAQIAPVNASAEPILELVPKNFGARRLRYGFNKLGTGVPELAEDLHPQTKKQMASRRRQRRKPNSARPGSKYDNAGGRNQA